MKRSIATLLLLCVGLSLCACSSDLPEAMNFYYLRSGDAIRYGTEDGLIAAEQREVPGNLETPEAFLSLYLAGPLNTTLHSPFPEGTEVEHLVLHQNSLILVMNDTLQNLSGVERTAAYACLARTCFSWLDVKEIVVLLPETETQESFSITLTRDSFLFLDESLPAETSKTLNGQ